jgi:hypothetical protein
VWKGTPVVSLIIGSDFLMAQGDTVDLDAVMVQPNGARQTVPAHWTSSNAQAIAVIPGFARAVAAAPGTATLFASFDTLHAQASVVVIDKQVGKVSPTPGDALMLDRFFMIEYQCPSSQMGDWCYAPQIRASAVPGRTVRVTTLMFSIPGLGAAPPLDCNTQLAATTRELNGDSYGDWLFYISETGHQATGASAGAFITFVDDAGKATTRVLDGPIVRGGLPWSSTGIGSAGACFSPPS